MCVFCDIASGNIPSNRVFETEDVIAILDIKPVSSGHILVMPKRHAANFEESDDTLLAKLISGVKQAGRLVKEKLGAPGYCVIENNDPVAGQVIPHIHFHVIPRYEGDGLPLWPGKDYQEGEAEEILFKLTRQNNK